MSDISHPFWSSAEQCRLAISNGASFLGRVFPLVAAQRVGVMNVNIVFSFTSSIMLFCWTKATDKVGIIVFDAFFGISSGRPIAYMRFKRNANPQQGAYAASFNPATASFAPHPNESGYVNSIKQRVR